MNKRDRYDQDYKPTRSDKYQYLLLETSCSVEFLESFSNEESIEGHLNPFKYDERIEILLDELKKEFWKMADKSLTDMQKRVLKLSADGYTQMEIAKMFDVNQSSITKCLNGNVDYKHYDERTGKPRVYGGAVKKLRKLVSRNERITEILLEISELRESNW